MSLFHVRQSTPRFVRRITALTLVLYYTTIILSIEGCVFGKWPIIIEDAGNGGGEGTIGK